MCDKVVDTNATDEGEPQQDDQSKGEAHFISPKLLNIKQNHQDLARDNRGFSFVHIIV